MVVQFILGRSGAGKTFHCVHSVRRELLQSPTGRRLLLLLPEQATFQVEQALLAHDDLSGFHRASVVSFERLARLVLNETCPPTLDPLSETAKQLLLRRLLHERRGHLRIFDRTADRSGFIAHLSHTIRELRQYAKTPQDLRHARENITQNTPEDSPLALKLHDLALIYDAYEQAIAGRFLDPDDRLDLLARQLPNCRLLRGAHLWMDGFAGFTAQQYRVLEALLPNVEYAAISLCLDPHSPAFKNLDAALDLPTRQHLNIDEQNLFATTLDTYRRLKLLLHRITSPPTTPILLPQHNPNLSPPGGDVRVPADRGGSSDHPVRQSQHNPNISPPGGDVRVPADRGGSSVHPVRQSQHNPSPLPLGGDVRVPADRGGSSDQACDSKCPRYQSPPLAQLEQTFEHHLHTPATPTNHLPAESNLPTQGLLALEAPNRRAEVDAAVRHVLRLCREQNYRFRDIAIILRDLKPYQDLLEAAFADHNIPCFLDQRRPVSRHPLVELIRSALAILAGDFASHDVIALLKTDLAGLDRHDVDALENHALAHGLDGQAWFSPTPWPDESLDRLRRHALAPLDRLRQQLPDPADTFPVRQLATALFALLDDLQVPARLQAWTDADRDAGRLEDAAVHEQAWTRIVTLLDELVETIPDARLTLAEFNEIANDALAQMTLALVPPALDQVLVGAIDRSRHPDVRAAFILGFNQGLFPLAPPAPGLLTDEQRAELLNAGCELAPPTRQNLLHERYLTYIALTRPSRFLWISYAAADDAGKPLSPSPLLPAIYASAPTDFCRLAPDAGHHRQPSLDRIAAPCDLAVELAGALAGLPDHELAPQPVSQLYHWAMAQPDLAPDLARGLEGLAHTNAANLDHHAAQQLLANYTHASVSRLETFAACPFHHFARYLLKLQPRERLRFEPLDLGLYYHDMLDRLFKHLQQQNRSWADLDHDEIPTLVNHTADALEANDPRIAALLKNAGRHRFLLELARRRLVLLVARLREAAAAGRFRQQFAEITFGDRNSWPPLTIPAGPGRSLHLRGKIDRIDLCKLDDGSTAIAVIDYKTGPRGPLNLTRLCHGLDLQLLAYLLVARQHLKPTPTPAAALYLPIVPDSSSSLQPPASSLQPSSPSSSDLQPPASSLQPIKARGLLNHNCLNLLDASVAIPGKSDWFGFGYKKDGGLNSALSRDVIPADDLEALLNLTNARLAQLAANLLDGCIAIEPFRLKNESPCPHCDFRCLCRFDFSRDDYRHLDPLDRDQVLEIARSPGGAP